MVQRASRRSQAGLCVASDLQLFELQVSLFKFYLFFTKRNMVFTNRHYIVLAVLGFSVLWSIIQLAVHDWMIFSIDQPSGQVSGSLGLWKMCVSSAGFSACIDLDCSEFGCDNWIKAVRFFSVMSFIFSVIGLGVLLFAFLKPTERARQLCIACLVDHTLSAFCAMLAFSIFVGKVNSDTPPDNLGISYHFGSGVAFAILLWLFDLAGVALLFYWRSFLFTTAFDSSLLSTSISQSTTVDEGDLPTGGQGIIDTAQ